MKVRKHVCVIGLGNFGGELARNLALEAEVLAIDIDADHVNEISAHVQRALCLDARDFTALSAVVSPHFDEAVVSMGGGLEASILTTLHLKQIGVPLIHAKALSDIHGSILQLVGAAEVIFPERETARRMAARMLNPNLLDFVPLEQDYLVRDVEPPEAAYGRTLAALDLRSCLNVFVLAVRKQTEPHFVFLPGPDYMVDRGDFLVMIGRERDLGFLESAQGFPVCPVVPH